jgi:DNA-binding HxlR family transcriptional regulator
LIQFDLERLEFDRTPLRTYHPEIRPRVEYEITDLGRSLAPLFEHLANWAGTHLETVEQARQHYDAKGPGRTPR